MSQPMDIKSLTESTKEYSRGDLWWLTGRWLLVSHWLSPPTFVVYFYFTDELKSRRCQTFSLELQLRFCLMSFCILTVCLEEDGSEGIKRSSFTQKMSASVSQNCSPPKWKLITQISLGQTIFLWEKSIFYSSQSLPTNTAAPKLTPSLHVLWWSVLCGFLLIPVKSYFDVHLTVSNEPFGLKCLKSCWRSRYRTAYIKGLFCQPWIINL